MICIINMGIDDKITEVNEIKHNNWVNDSIEDYISREKFNYPLSKEIYIDDKKILFQHYMLNEDLEKDKYPFKRMSIKIYRL